MTANTVKLFAEQFNFCFWCFDNPARYDPLEVHHIERRSHARKSLVNNFCNLFMGHRSCHAGPLATASHAEQLAHKFFCDAASYYQVEHLLSDWLPIRIATRPAPDRVTLGEVLAFLNPLVMLGLPWSDTEWNEAVKMLRPRIRSWDNYESAWRRFNIYHAGLCVRLGYFARLQAGAKVSVGMIAPIAASAVMARLGDGDEKGS